MYKLGNETPKKETMDWYNGLLGRKTAKNTDSLITICYLQTYTVQTVSPSFRMACPTKTTNTQGC